MIKTANHLFGFPVRWRMRLPDYAGWGMAPQPLSSLVVVSSGPNVVGIDAKTGSVQWTTEVVDLSGQVFAVINDTIITDSCDDSGRGHFVGLDMNGAIRWDVDLGGIKTEWEVGSESVACTVCGDEGLFLAVVTGDGQPNLLRPPHGGSIVARTKSGWVLRSSSLSRDGVLSSFLYSWDGGTETHVASDESAPQRDSEFRADDYVFLVEGTPPEHRLVCRHQRDLSVRWSQPIPSVPPYGAHMVVGAEQIFAGMGPDASLPTAIDFSTGAILWQGESLMSDLDKITVSGEFVLFTSHETTALYHCKGELVGTVENWLINNFAVTDDALLLLVGNEVVCLDRLTIPLSADTSIPLSSPAAPSCFTYDFEAEEINLARRKAKNEASLSKLAFQRCSSMRGARCNAASALLDDGRVLVAGGATARGATGSMVASCELYEPKRDRWRVASRLLMPRQDLAMMPLTDGRVLAIGGRLNNRTPLSNVEVFDPAQDQWTALPALSTPVWGARITPIDDDRSLLIGGFGPDGPSQHTWWINRHTGSLAPGPPTLHTHGYPGLASLGDGRVMVSSLETEIFENGAWRELAPRPLGSADATSLAALADGSVLLSGGRDAEDEHARTDTVLWKSDGYATPQNFRTGGRHGHQFATIGDEVVAIGGVTGAPGRFVDHWESWTAADGWKRLRNYDCRWLHTQVQLLDDSVLVIGGVLADGDSPDIVASAEVSRVLPAQD